MKRTLMLLAAVVVMLWLAYAHDASAAEEQPIAQATVSVHSGLLNGRSKPTKDSSIEARFSDGDVLDIYEVQGDWARTEGGEAGFCWVSIHYLVTGEHGTYTVASNGRVRVRETPDGKAVRYVNNGDTVEVQFIIDGWAYIGDGYVMAEYLQEKE